MWKWNKWDVLMPSLIFTVMNALRIPLVDRPVHRDSLALAIMTSVEREDVRGVQRFMQVDRLAQFKSIATQK